MHCIVIDEDKESQAKYNSILRKLPYVDSFTILGTVEDALSFIRKCKSYTVIISEMDFLEGVSGIDLARIVKEIDPTCFVLFVTNNMNCLREAFSVHANGYIEKPISPSALESELAFCRSQIPANMESGIVASTFGDFELFVNNEQVSFESAKAKELLAYFIDRRGASVTCEQAISALWEDRPYDANTRSLCRMAMTQLRRSLDKVGSRHILREARNSKSVDTSTFICDYYDFLKGDADSVKKYSGEYMRQYYWAADTTAMLDMEKAEYNDEY